MSNVASYPHIDILAGMVGTNLQASLADIGVAAALSLNVFSLAADTVSHRQRPRGVLDEVAGVVKGAYFILTGHGNTRLHRNRTQLWDTDATGGLRLDEMLLMIPVEGIDKVFSKTVDLEINDTTSGNPGIFITPFSILLAVHQNRAFTRHEV